MLALLALAWAARADAQSSAPAGPASDGRQTSTATASAATSTPVASGAGPYLPRQGLDCSDFVRSADGRWTAVRAVSLPAPEGVLRIDPGVVERPGQFAGGYDLGAMLEHQCPH